MPIESTTEGKHRVVKLSGRMSPELAVQFEQACQGSAETGYALLVDIAELQYVSSMGLRSFVQVAKAAHGAGGVVVLCGMKGLVKEIFEMAHMGSLFRTFDSVDAARASLG
jgi:anti-anti-sigma factor